VIETGTTVMAGDAEQLRRDPGVQRAYLGADPDELLAGVPGSG
jgi:ABC-type lipopolysaccharide export system ATPase subunit